MDNQEVTWTTCDTIKAEDVEELGYTQSVHSTSSQSDSKTTIEALTKDGASPSKTDDHVDSLQRLLTKQFSHMHKVLTESYESAKSLAGRHAGALRRAENEASELAGENEKLRAQLAGAGLSANCSDSAGTGESTGGSMNKPAHRGLNTASSSVRDGASKAAGFFGLQDTCLPPPTATEVMSPSSKAPSMNLPGAAWTYDTQEAPKTSSEECRHSFASVDSNDNLVDISLGLKRSSRSSNKEKRLSVNSASSSGRDVSMAAVVPSSTRATKSSQATRQSRNSHTSENCDSQMPEEIQHDLHDGGHAKVHAVFADAAAMKEKVRQAIGKEEYNVCNMYHDKGFFATIARNHWFDTITLSVIALNAIWIAVDTDYNDEDFLLDYKPVFQVAENFFCVYFSCEWVIRFMSFKRKRDGLKDAWFVFDSCLVGMMVLETWVMTFIVVLTGGGQGGGLKNASILRLLRLLRLTRMARMARLLRAMPELMIMIKGIAVAARSVFFTLVLLVLIMYVFAICFTQITVDQSCRDAYFKSVPDAMLTLLLYGTLLEDVPDVVLAVGADSYLFGALFLFFILLASCTVMNMLVGVLVEVVSVVSAVEKETLMVNFVRSQLEQMLSMSGIDANNDNMISKEEFESLLENPKAANALQEVGVDVVGLVDFTDFIFKDGVELSFPDFMETVLQLRGSNTATVKDVVDLRKFIMSGLEEIEEAILTGHSRQSNNQNQGVNHQVSVLSSKTRGFASTVLTSASSASAAKVAKLRHSGI